MRILAAPRTWTGINSIAVADDGRVFAGEMGRSLGVAGWSADGALLWERSFGKPEPKSIFGKEVVVQLVGKQLAVQARRHNDTSSLPLLDLATGKTVRTLKTPSMHAYRVAGDRIVCNGYDTHVASFPAMKKLGKLRLHTESMQVAASRDGKWGAVNSTECHVIDVKKAAHARSFPLDADVDALAFTHDGKIVAGDDKARLRFYDIKGKRIAEVVLAYGTRAPTVLAIATSAKHIAASLRGGTVVVLDAKTRKELVRYEKHVVSKEGSGWFGPGANALAFDAKGKTLWVSATTKKGTVGLTGYPMS